jgi:hypothetical protein
MFCHLADLFCCITQLYKGVVNLPWHWRMHFFNPNLNAEQKRIALQYPVEHFFYYRFQHFLRIGHFLPHR